MAETFNQQIQRMETKKNKKKKDVHDEREVNESLNKQIQSLTDKYQQAKIKNQTLKKDLSQLTQYKKKF